MPCIAEAAGKVNHYGIETIDEITYQGWEPGKEYTKNIVLKNVKVNTQKLTYHVPQSRFFSTLYPKQITLSAGTSFVLPVTFRPLEKNIYEDKIKFASKDGDFVIPIKAVLPVHDVAIPDHQILPLCAVNDETSVQFTIVNKCELKTPFHWEVEDHFTIEPAHGILQPFSNMRLTVYFRPTAARIYECQAKCLHGNAYERVMITRLEGTGKYPHLLVACASKPFDKNNETHLNFGSVPFGTSVQKPIEIFNHSEVEAKCTITQPHAVSSIDAVFSCLTTHAIVPPQGSIQVLVKYTPTTVQATSVDYFVISSVSNINKMTVKCTGTCAGPQVELSVNMINFSLINVGESATRTLEITNQSAVITSYQFKIDCFESVFKFDCTNAQLKPRETKKVIIKFWPTHPINYYRSVACVIENQPPLMLDLLGTAHSETTKPSVLENHHLTRFFIHAERGLTVFPPEHLNEMLASGKLELDGNKMLMNAQAESLEPYLHPVGVVPPMDKYFNDGYHSDLVHLQPHVSLSTIQIDFGQNMEISNIESKIVTLTNHTKGKITVQWIGDESHMFYVMPNTMELPPLKSADFRVHFKPAGPNNFFGCELECFCYYKSLRDYRLVEDLTHMPPFCLTLTVIAGTFQQNHQTFLPQLSFSSRSLVFPPVNLNEPSYRTLTISREGKTPIIFDFEDSEIFSVKPKKGIIMKDKEIFVVRALPNQVKTYRRSIKLNLNYDKKYKEELSVICSAETPEILLSNKGELYFKQTCIGVSSEQRYSVKNISRMPLVFCWVIKHIDQRLIKIEPAEGVILPNENQEHTFVFTPREVKKHLMKPTLVVHAQGQHSSQSGGKRKAFPVRAIGLGTVGEIQADESFIDFGSIMVGSSDTRLFAIRNCSDCTLQYRLSVEQRLDGSTTNGPFTCALQLDEYEGALAAQSKRLVRAIFRPTQRCHYQCSIAYQLLLPESEVKESEPRQLIEVVATGVFPLLAVKDARIHGSGCGLSKKQLWKLFHLDSLNQYLDSDPSEGEMRYSVATRNSTRKRPPVLTRAILDFNFSAAPVGSDPCHVTLHFENTGTVICDWDFLFPSDLQMELEYWSETAEYTNDELHEMKVMDNQLFSVQPKRGRLSPGETCSVTFSYKHLMAGTDRVPVLLKLDRGREILLNFVGVTVAPEMLYIHYPSNSHQFAPVAIGEKNCPKQIYELYNGGSLPVQFEISTLPLELLRRENFEHPVFECLNPKGIIPPGKSHAVEWKFFPLEAKTYTVDVPIHISRGETALITFSGVGYDKKQLGDTMPAQVDNANMVIPDTQMATVPGQTVCLSHERVTLGNIPLFCKTRKIVFLRNVTDHAISFSWHVTNEGDDKIVNVSPAVGTLGPHRQQLIKVVFTAAGEPAFYDMDMICEVVDETEMAHYRRKLRDWEAERERQMLEFTVTEKDIDADKRAHSRVPSATDRTEEDGVVTRFKPEEAKFKPYKTLPPIVDRSVDKERVDAAQKQRLDWLLYKKPDQPAPCLIHLGIIARTHSIPSFQENFPDDLGLFFIDKSLERGESLKGSAHSHELPLAIRSDLNEANILTGTIANVLRSLIEDTSFHAAVVKLCDEKVPYFNQYKRDTPQDTLVKGTRGDDHPATRAQSQRSIRKATRSQGSEPGFVGGSSEQSGRERVSSDRKLIASQQELANPATQSTRRDKPVLSTEDELGPEETIFRAPEFANLVEDIIENTLSNIMLEACSGEINLTTRPRLIALPPRHGVSPKQ